FTLQRKSHGRNRGFETLTGRPYSAFSDLAAFAGFAAFSVLGVFSVRTGFSPWAARAFSASSAFVGANLSPRSERFQRGSGRPSSFFASAWPAASGGGAGVVLSTRTLSAPFT